MAAATKQDLEEFTKIILTTMKTTIADEVKKAVEKACCSRPKETTLQLKAAVAEEVKAAIAEELKATVADEPIGEELASGLEVIPDTNQVGPVGFLDDLMARLYHFIIAGKASGKKPHLKTV
eukprot:tig00000404_g392.t1